MMNHVDSDATTAAQRSAYLLTVWQSPDSSLLRGYVETTAGKRQYFGSASELIQLLTRHRPDVQLPTP